VSVQTFDASRPLSAVLLSVVLTLGTGLVLAMSSDDDDGENKSEPSSALAVAREHVRAKAWEEAIPKLEEALAEDESNADILNLLGFSHRQLTQHDEALTYYQRALKIDPEHLGANEYLGELYLKTGRLDDALARLQVLDDACFLPCKEYTELKGSIEKYKARKGIK